MADKIKASQVDGTVQKAKNGRYYVRLKVGGSRMLSDDDAKRLRAELRGKSTSKPKPKPASKPKPKPRSSGGSSKKKDDKPKRRSSKKYLADFL